MQERLYLGNLGCAARDWGMRATTSRLQWLMLQQDTPEDFVIATGQRTRCVSSSPLPARGDGHHGALGRPGRRRKRLRRRDRQMHRRDRPALFPPVGVETLLGDASKAKAKLGWSPTTTFAELVHEMAVADLKDAERDVLLNRQRRHLRNTGGPDKYLAPRFAHEVAAEPSRARSASPRAPVCRRPFPRPGARARSWPPSPSSLRALVGSPIRTSRLGGAIECLVHAHDDLAGLGRDAQPHRRRNPRSPGRRRRRRRGGRTRG